MSSSSFHHWPLQYGYLSLDVGSGEQKVEKAFPLCEAGEVNQEIDSKYSVDSAVLVAYINSLLDVSVCKKQYRAD